MDGEGGVEEGREGVKRGGELCEKQGRRCVDVGCGGNGEEVLVASGASSVEEVGDCRG